MNTKIIKIAIVTNAVLYLSACAFVPENIKLQPQVKYQHSRIGYGKNVAVHVIDARSDLDLGGRASAYGPAASITLANDISQVVKRTVYKGLRANNFKPVANGKATTSLTVRILNLKYKQSGGLFTAGIAVNSSIEAQARNTGNMNYDQIYHGNSTFRVAFTPTHKKDEKNINQSLSESLSKLTNDRQLMKFLAK